MKRLSGLWLMFCLFLPAGAVAQPDLTVSVSNALRFGTGSQAVGSVTTKKEYLENLTDARILLSDFLIGFRLLYDAPPEFGVEFRGLKKRYAEFTRDALRLRAGDSYALFGRGLSLNLFENRALAYDTGLEGLKAEYTTRIFKVAATAGDVVYRDIIDLTRSEEYRLRGAAVELRPYSFLTLGTGFVSGTSQFPPPTYPAESAQFNIPEFFGRVQTGPLELALSYAEKRTTVYGKEGTHTGTAMYGSASYTDEGFGATLEYKDYRYGIADPYERSSPNRATKMFAFQNPPSVVKQHSLTLPSRYPHVIDFNDEVGIQLDLLYTLFDRLTGNVNGAVSSRHYNYTPTGDTNAIFLPIYGSSARSMSFLPSFAAEYSPFWEIYADVQLYFEEGGSDFVLLAFDRRVEEIADEVASAVTGSTRTDATRTTAGVIAVQHEVGGGWVLKAEAESQWVHEDKNPASQDYFNQLLSVGLSSAPSYTLTLRYEFTSDEGTVDGKRNWPALEAGYRLGEHHTISMTVGADRGGQICANGVCRVVAPFNGVRLGAVSYF